jgi:hypothetical protein
LPFGSNHCLIRANQGSLGGFCFKKWIQWHIIPSKRWSQNSCDSKKKGFTHSGLEEKSLASRSSIYLVLVLRQQHLEVWLFGMLSTLNYKELEVCLWPSLAFLLGKRKTGHRN